MTNAELIKALRYCAEHDGCDYYIAKDCPRENTWLCGADCEQILMHDAANALEAAEKRIAELSLDNKMLKNTIDADKGVMLDRIRFLEAQLPKEGEWVWDADTGIYRCSECGGASPQEDQDGEYIDCPNYCPNCGAKMKGEEK